jgi:hypothetical protein
MTESLTRAVTNDTYGLFCAPVSSSLWIEDSRRGAGGSFPDSDLFGILGLAWGRSMIRVKWNGIGVLELDILCKGALKILT